MASRAPRVIVDLEDDPRHQALLHKFADPGRGIIHVEARPDNRTRSLFPLNRAIARGYGKRTDRPGWIAERTRFGQQLRAWMTGETCRLLIVSRANHLDGNNWLHIADLAQLADVEPWLLVQGCHPTRGQKSIAARLGARDATFQMLERRLRTINSTPSTRTSPTPPRFPHVPQSEFFRFLHDCSRLLDDHDFERVQEVFRAGRREITTWRDRGGGNESELAALLRQIPAGDTSRAATWLRGAQVGLLGGDLQLWLGLDRLSQQLAGSQAISGLTPEIVRELRTIFGSPWACAAVIAIVLGSDLDLVSQLTLADIAPDGARITANGREHRVPAYARGILRTQLALRREQKARQSAPLLTIHGKTRRDRHRRLDADGIWDLLKAVADATGLAVLGPWSPRVDEPPLRWAARHGIHIRRVYAAATFA